VFQSPDGDSVVSHKKAWRLHSDKCTGGFSPLTGIPWFPTRCVMMLRWVFRWFGFSPLTGIPWFPTRKASLGLRQS